MSFDLNVQTTMEVSVGDNELSIKSVNGKNYICPALLEKILSDRDEKISRIERATETRRRQYTAKTREELDNISIPEDFWRLCRMGNGVLHFRICIKR